jgi:hypothetical protein
MGRAFLGCAGELGMCSAAWLFCETAYETGGADELCALMDALGRDFPVLDAVGRAVLSGGRPPLETADEVRLRLVGLEEVVFIGHEALFLDTLLPVLPPDLHVSLLRPGDAHTNWPRVVANLRGRLDTVTLADFQRAAGPGSALVTFTYGAQETTCHVMPTWLRVAGPDVRVQFRSLIGWEVMRDPFFVYPRWLVEADRAQFTDHVGPAVLP